MQEARHPTTKPQPPPPSPSAPAADPLPYHHHHYGTFPPPSQPPPTLGAAYHASPIGFGGQGVVAFPCAVQQQVFVEGVPVREPPLPFCGVGIGWFLFLLGFFLAAIPWYAGAFLLFFVALDHREKPGLIACTIAGIFALVPFILNGIRMSTVVHSASIPSKDYRHEASSSTKHVVDGTWNEQIHGVHASIAGKHSTTVRPVMSCDSKSSQDMNDPRSLAPSYPWQPNIIHFPNHAVNFQNPPFRGSLLDATGPAQYVPVVTPSIDSRPGQLYLYLHQPVTAEVAPRDKGTVQAVHASHGPVPVAPYSMPGVYRT